MDICWLFVALAVLFLAVLVYLHRSGLFRSIVIEEFADSPYPAARVFYKFSTGDYKNCGKFFWETASLAPTLKCIGIYYDDPRDVSSTALMYLFLQF